LSPFILVNVGRVVNLSGTYSVLREWQPDLILVGGVAEAAQS